MGMYAEINVCFDLTKGTPKNVVDVLYYLIDDNDKPSDLPNHEFFKCDRWDMVACCDSYYFDGMMLSRLVDTFFSRTSWTMLLYAENHSISVA